MTTHGGAGGMSRQVELMREQARSCRTLGSPFYAEVLDRLAGDVADGGVGARVLAGYEDAPGPSALALRLLAAVHRLVLTGRAPRLAAHYPSVGGDGDATAAWPAFRLTLEDHLDQVRAGLTSPPQTNEVGRSAALFGGLLRVLGAGVHPEQPVRLAEIGSSAGLNLLADQFTYRSADGDRWAGSWSGDEQPGALAAGARQDPADTAGLRQDPADTTGPQVVLDPAWETRPPGIPPCVEVVERLGSDLAPIDPRTDDGALTLVSCVWPDQTDRMDRLRGALRLAQRHPVTLHRTGAGDFVEELELRQGCHTVLWHSVMWQYVPAAEQRRILARLEELGATAAPDRPLTHLAFEPRRLVPGGRHRFVVTATTWPGGTEQVLGEAPPHGVPVRWGAGCGNGWLRPRDAPRLGPCVTTTSSDGRTGPPPR